MDFSDFLKEAMSSIKHKEKARVKMTKDQIKSYEELAALKDEIKVLTEKLDFKRDRMLIMFKEDTKHYGDMSIDPEKKEIILYE